MKANTALTIILSALFLGSVFAVVQPAAALPGHNSGYLPFPGAYFNGNITIEPDGSLNVSGAPISSSGNYYNLTGNINGSINIEKNGTVLNGNGYGIVDNYLSSYKALNISNVHGVSVSNLKVNSSMFAIGVYVNNSSGDLLNHLNISTMIGGVIVANDTSYINVSNSIIKTDGQHTTGYAALGLGIYLVNTFPGLYPSKTSSHIAVYNDTVTAIGSFLGIALGASNSSLTGSDFNLTGTYINMLIGGNNTTINGNTIRGNYVYNGIDMSSAYGSILKDVSFVDNYYNVSSTVNSGSEALFFYATGTVSGNTILINASGNSYGAITASGGNTTFSGNTISMYDGGTGSISGLYASGSNETVTGNNLKMSGGSSSTAIALSPLGPRMGNNIVSHNKIRIDSAQATGILAAGSNSTLQFNTLSINDTAKATGIGYSNQGYKSSNVNIQGNQIEISGPKTTSEVQGITATGSSSYSMNNFSVSGNTVYDNQNSSYGLALFIDYSNSLSVYDNTATLNASSVLLQVDSSAKVTIRGNSLAGDPGKPVQTDGIYIYSSSEVSILNNTVSNTGTGLFEDDSIGITFEGNSVTNSSVFAIRFDGGSNSLVYHNNFIGYAIAFDNFSSLGIRLDAGYPTGGNYWSGYSGSDMYSGASQNVKGADGIGDTPMALGTNAVDNYPLMKRWVRPQAVFHETGLLKGSEWSVTFNGQTKTSDSPTITFYIQNGTYQSYSFSISGASGYKGGGTSGTFDYANNNYSSSTPYTPYYTIKFIETGLPGGTSWSLELNGTKYTVTSSTYSVTALNGTTFAYAAGNQTLYYTTNVPAHVILAGGNMTVRITFVHYSYINLTVSPQGASVYVNGKEVNLTGGGLNLSVVEGSYTVLVKDGGYVTQYDNFTLNPGQTESVHVSLKRVTGIASSTYAYIGGGVAAVAIVASLVVYLRRPKA